MGRFFNIAGPCNPAKHYTLSSMERMPNVMSLLRDEAYFVVHAPRQCGKTTAFFSLCNEINSGDKAMAMCCSLEIAQAFPAPERGLPIIYEKILGSALRYPKLRECPFLREGHTRYNSDTLASRGILELLSELASYAGKPFYVFFDEADCLSGATLITLLRQLREGKIYSSGGMQPFPASIALIGMRNIRDYKARIRPESETLGSASPFNVITKAMTIGMFSFDEVRSLYRQHTNETGQVFEPGVVEKACEYSGGQPYLVNALARWCVDEIHGRKYDAPITLADMHEAKEQIIRERGTHLDSIMERMKEPRVRRIVEPVMLGEDLLVDEINDDLSFVMDLGLLKRKNGILQPANPMYAEIMGRYLSWGNQIYVREKIQETPWVKDDGLDMAGLLAAFQEFWRENAANRDAPFEYRESYCQIVLQAFLQRVINGGGEIIREMALGSQRLDLEVRFRGAKYALECKKLAFYEKSPEKAHKQVLGYIDRLGLSEGWLIVFDPDFTKPWEGKISSADLMIDGKTIHVLRC